VQPVGARGWTNLSRVVDVRAWGLPPKIRKKRRASGSAAAADVVEDSPPQGWRSLTAAIVFLLGALGAGFWAVFPGTSLPDLDGVPWREIALVQLLLGLALIRGWAVARRVVRVAVLLLSFAVFPVAGLLVAQGQRGRVYLVLFAAWVLASGLFALLSGSRLRPLRSVLCAAAAVLGLAGVGYFGYVPPGVGHRGIEERGSSARRFQDATLRLSAQLPAGWYVLETPAAEGAAGSLVPADSKLRLAHPRLGAFGYLQAERSLPGVTSADQYLDRLVARRRERLPSLQAGDRSDVKVGRLPGRSLSSTWTTAEGRFHERTVAWQDGWSYFGLVAWSPEVHASRLQSEFSGLVGGFAPDGRESEELRRTTASVSEELPNLSPRAVELLLAARWETTLGVPEACRRGWQASLHGRASLDGLEVRELARMDALMTAALDRREQPRFLAYLERLRGEGPTSPDEDQEMARRTRTAVLALPESSRIRLQALNEKAIAAP
jgi:hypothetical protein